MAGDHGKHRPSGTTRPCPGRGTGGRRSAIAGVVAIALLLALAVWKPWEERVATRPAATPSVDGAAGLIPADTDRAGVADAAGPVRSPAAPTFAGLDLSMMGAIDPHDAWGVAIGYVSQAQFDIAAHAVPTVTPVVSWELVDPAKPWPGPTLDRCRGPARRAAGRHRRDGHECQPAAPPRLGLVLRPGRAVLGRRRLARPRLAGELADAWLAGRRLRVRGGPRRSRPGQPAVRHRGRTGPLTRDRRLVAGPAIVDRRRSGRPDPGRQPPAG